MQVEAEGQPAEHWRDHTKALGDEDPLVGVDTICVGEVYGMATPAVVESFAHDDSMAKRGELRGASVLNHRIHQSTHTASTRTSASDISKSSQPSFLTMIPFVYSRNSTIKHEMLARIQSVARPPSPRLMSGPTFASVVAIVKVSGNIEETSWSVRSFAPHGVLGCNHIHSQPRLSGVRHDVRKYRLYGPGSRRSILVSNRLCWAVRPNWVNDATICMYSSTDEISEFLQRRADPPLANVSESTPMLARYEGITHNPARTLQGTAQLMSVVDIGYNVYRLYSVDSR